MKSAATHSRKPSPGVRPHRTANRVPLQGKWVLLSHTQPTETGKLVSYQVPELRRQTPIGGLLHVHHFRVRAQNVELPESRQYRAEILKRLGTSKQTQ